MKDPALANESWDRFLPKFKSSNVQRKKPKKRKEKPYTPFPPPQPESKVDKELASGEYFLKEKERLERKRERKKTQQDEAVQRHQAERQQAFQPPEEGSVRGGASEADDSIDVEALKKKVTHAMKGKRKKLRIGS